MKNKKTSILQGHLKRTLSGISLGARLGVQMGKSRLSKGEVNYSSEEWDQVASVLIAKMGKLKGLAMKLGQMLSYVDPQIPESARKIFSQLQRFSQPMEMDQVERAIKASLGKELKEMFATFDPTPVASASIGQVHKAQLHTGEWVAVKVQYPEIKGALDSDFKALKGMGKLIDKLIPQSAGPVIEELKERLLEECDYRIEGKNQKHFQHIFKDNPGIIIPQIYPELSSDVVLTTEWMEGATFQEFQAQGSREQKNTCGALIYEFVAKAGWEFHCFNADPHPGNFLFRDNQIVCLDFGCVKYWTEEFVQAQQEMIEATFTEDLKAFTQLAIRDGYVVKPEGYDFQMFMNMVALYASPYHHDKRFNFDKSFMLALHDASWKFSDPTRLRCPKDFVFANRLWFGLYAMLADLEASFNAHEIFYRYYPEKKKGLSNRPNS